MHYIICTVQRCGKTWLCRTLKELRCFGWPEEYVNLIERQVDLKTVDQSLLKVFEDSGVKGLINFVQDLTKEKTGQSHTVGLVLQQNQISFLSRSLSIPEEEILPIFISEMSPKIYYLKRKDVLQQAISHYISSASGIAHSFQLKSRDISEREVPFSAEQINKHLTFCRNSYAKWDKLFQMFGIDPDVIFYEELCDDICSVICRMSECVAGGRQLEDRIIQKASGRTSKIGNQTDARFREEIEKFLNSEKQGLLPSISSGLGALKNFSLKE